MIWFLKHTTTSELVCAMRGALYYDDEHPFHRHFHDPYAASLCGYPLKSLFWLPTCSRVLTHALFPQIMSRSVTLLLRSWIAEKHIKNFVAAGGTQVVMVAAGLDSFQLRHKDLLSRIQLYELDTPDSVHKKKERLLQIQPTLHPSCHFVPAKLSSTMSISQALRDSSLDFRQPVFFSILGLSYYLKTTTFFLCMKDIAQACSAGTTVAIDYMLDDELLSSSDQRRYTDHIKATVANMGENMHFTSSPPGLEQRMKEIAFDPLEHTILDDLYGPYGLKNHATAGSSPYAVAVFQKHAGSTSKGPSTAQKNGDA